MTTPLPTDWRAELPFPPSNHDVFGKHNGSYLSKAYRAWRDLAGLQLNTQHMPRVSGPVAVLIELRAPDRKRRDVDNYTKGPLDLLVAHGLIEADDSRIVKEITARWVDAGAPCAVYVRGVLPEVRG